jgi:hypothetical protein
MLFTKCTETFQIFIYQSAVFYAQWSLVHYKDYFVPDKYACFEPDANTFTPLYDWIVIEIILFYIYIVSSIVYIASHIIVEWS